MNKILPSQSVKRSGSPLADASESAAKKRSRREVEISEHAWFEVLKYLTCLQWSRMRLVSHHLNGVVQRNFSRLPLIVINNVAVRLKEGMNPETKIIVSDSALPQDEEYQWFMDHGITLDLPASIQLEKTIIGADPEQYSCFDLCVLGSDQKKKLTPTEKRLPCFSGQQFKADVLFYAEFNPPWDQFSWLSMQFFLKKLYDPSTRIKELSMYPFDTKLKEFLFPGEEERYIRCGSFTLQVTPGATTEDLIESMLWLEQNVQADTVQLPTIFHNTDIDYHKNDVCESMTNYLLGSSWISAKQTVKLGEVDDLQRFFGILIKKFRTVTAVQRIFRILRIFPTIVFSGHRLIYGDPLYKLFSGKGIVKEGPDDVEYNDEFEYAESDDWSGDSEDDSDDSQSDDFISRYNNGNDEAYTISSGVKRMRVEFVRIPDKQSNPRERLVSWPTAYKYEIRVIFYEVE